MMPIIITCINLLFSFLSMLFICFALLYQRIFKIKVKAGIINKINPEHFGLTLQNREVVNWLILLKDMYLFSTMLNRCTNEFPPYPTGYIMYSSVFFYGLVFFTAVYIFTIYEDLKKAYEKK